MQTHLGPRDTYTGAMNVAITRNVKHIRVLDSATFSVLVFMYPANEDDAVNPASITYPALSELNHVLKFQLSSGSIEVIYYT